MTDTPSLRDGLLASGETLSSLRRPRPDTRRHEASGALGTAGGRAPMPPFTQETQA